MTLGHSLILRAVHFLSHVKVPLLHALRHLLVVYFMHGCHTCCFISDTPLYCIVCMAITPEILNRFMLWDTHSRTTILSSFSFFLLRSAAVHRHPRGARRRAGYGRTRPHTCPPPPPPPPWASRRQPLVCARPSTPYGPHTWAPVGCCRVWGRGRPRARARARARTWAAAREDVARQVPQHIHRAWQGIFAYGFFA